MRMGSGALLYWTGPHTHQAVKGEMTGGGGRKSKRERDGWVRLPWGFQALWHTASTSTSTYFRLIATNTVK